MAGFWVVQSRVYFSLKRQALAAGSERPCEHIPLRLRAPAEEIPQRGFAFQHLFPKERQKNKNHNTPKEEEEGGRKSAAWVLFFTVERGEKIRECDVP